MSFSVISLFQASMTPCHSARYCAGGRSGSEVSRRIRSTRFPRIGAASAIVFRASPGRSLLAEWRVGPCAHKPCAHPVWWDARKSAPTERSAKVARKEDLAGHATRWAAAGSRASFATRRRTSRAGVPPYSTASLHRFRASTLALAPCASPPWPPLAPPGPPSPRHGAGASFCVLFSGCPSSRSCPSRPPRKTAGQGPRRAAVPLRGSWPHNCPTEISLPHIGYSLPQFP